MDNLFRSSTGEGVSLTAKGLALGGFLPLLLVVTALLRSAFGIDITDEAAVQIVELGILIGSSLVTLVGLVRKVVVSARS